MATQVPPLFHGGDLSYASAVYGEPAQGWQDLSTGVSPWSYPVVNVPTSVWQQLPGNDSALLHAASVYYHTPANTLQAVPGSQYAIAYVPTQLVPARVALPHIGYQEHERSWLKAGHKVHYYKDVSELQALLAQRQVTHAVLINPGNPLASMVAPEHIKKLCQTLSPTGVLLVDEAFMDSRAEHSVTPLVRSCEQLLVLRSVGKFFGLAGLRLGFLAAHQHSQLLAGLQQSLQPWGVSHPALWLGERVLRDRHWQVSQRLRIRTAAHKLHALWQHFSGHAAALSQADLFTTLHGDFSHLHGLHAGLAKKGIWTRWCEWPAAPPVGQAWLRCGLPADGGVYLQQVLEGLYDSGD